MDNLSELRQLPFFVFVVMPLIVHLRLLKKSIQMLDNFKAKLERFCFRNLRRIFVIKGYYLGRATGKELVRDFIQSLCPMNTGYDLIRMGAEGDGGYLVPDDLEGIEACFSPGIGAKSKFEEDCLSYGIKTYLADASVDSLPINNDQLHFTKKFVAAYNNDSFMTLDSWVDSASITVDSDLLLQMDIEGSEYEVLTNMSENLLKRFRLIVLEVHFLDHLWGVDFYKMASAAFIKILKNHTCVHIHPNNTSPIVKINDLEIAPTVEITFLRNDRIKSKSPAIEFPHPLDADNSDKEAVVLPRNWYQN